MNIFFGAQIKLMPIIEHKFYNCFILNNMLGGGSGLQDEMLRAYIDKLFA